MKKFSKLTQCYLDGLARIGEPLKGPWRGALLPGFFNPHGSPVFLKRGPLALDLKKVRLLRKLGSKSLRKYPSSFSLKTPYVVFEKDSRLSAREKMHLESLGFRRNRALDFTLAAFSKCPPFEMPKGYAVSIYDAVDPALSPIFTKLIKSCFGLSKKRSLEALRGFHRMNKKARSYFVVMRKKRMPVALGSVTPLGGGLGALFNGCTLPAHRKRGLWRSMTTLRLQMIQCHAEDTRSRRAFLTTVNPVLIKEAEFRQRMQVWTLAE